MISFQSFICAFCATIPLSSSISSSQHIHTSIIIIMPPVPIINSEKFRCEDGSEISRLRVRDGVRNCFGGSDELPPSSQPVLNNNNIIEKEKEEDDKRKSTSTDGGDVVHGEVNIKEKDDDIVADIAGLFTQERREEERRTLRIKIAPEIAAANNLQFR